MNKKKGLQKLRLTHKKMKTNQDRRKRDDTNWDYSIQTPPPHLPPPPPPPPAPSAFHN